MRTTLFLSSLLAGLAVAQTAVTTVTVTATVTKPRRTITKTETETLIEPGRTKTKTRTKTVTQPGSTVTLSGCTTAPSGSSSTTSSTTSSTASPSASVHPASQLGDFPDPSIITVDGTYYAFATNGDQYVAGGNGYHIQLATTTNFKDPSSWQLYPHDVLPNLPSWVNQTEGQVWAPGIVQLSDGSFALYYSAQLAQYEGTHCIGLARSSTGNVEGPYADGSNYPFICPIGNRTLPNVGANFQCDTIDRGGAIDGAPFFDPAGNLYLVYKEDGPSLCGGGWAGGVDPAGPQGNHQCQQTRLMIQPLGADGYSGVTCSNPPTELYNNDGYYDGYNVEAPSLVLSSDKSTYFLFFSVNVFDGIYYHTDYITSNSTLGTYGNRNTLLNAPDTSQPYSPGSMTVALTGGDAVFHGDFEAGNSSVRWLYDGQVSFSGQTASIVIY